VRVSTDGHTHAQTDAKRFYYLSHAICYSHMADNNVELNHLQNQQDIVNSVNEIMKSPGFVGCL